MFCYCASARRIARLLTARYDAALSKADLTAAQFETLCVLSARGRSSGRALAQHLALDKTTLSRNLKPLLEANLVQSAPDEADARSILYSLTAAGKRRLAKAMPLWQAAHSDTTGMLGPNAAASQHSLQRLAQALQ